MYCDKIMQRKWSEKYPKNICRQVDLSTLHMDINYVNYLEEIVSPGRIYLQRSIPSFLETTYTIQHG